MKKLNYFTPFQEKRSDVVGTLIPLLAYVISAGCVAWAYGITSHFCRIENATALANMPRGDEYEASAIWYPAGLTLLSYLGLMTATARITKGNDARLRFVLIHCVLSACIVIATLHHLYMKVYL